MTITLKGHSQQLVMAIREVFHRAQPCRCQGDGKLSESEVLAALVRLGHVHYADANDPRFLPISEIEHGAGFHASWELGRHGVHFLPQLESWSFADLLKLDRIGPAAAAKIEAAMAKYGLSLRDGDPNRYRHLLEQEPEAQAEGPAITGTADDVRQACRKDLMNLSEVFLRHGISLARYAVRVPSNKPLAGRLKDSARKAIGYGHQVIGLANILHELERREATAPPVPTPDQRRVVRAAARPSNVIPGRFGGVAS